MDRLLLSSRRGEREIKSEAILIVKSCSFGGTLLGSHPPKGRTTPPWKEESGIQSIPFIVISSLYPTTRETGILSLSLKHDLDIGDLLTTCIFLHSNAFPRNWQEEQEDQKGVDGNRKFFKVEGISTKRFINCTVKW